MLLQCRFRIRPMCVCMCVIVILPQVHCSPCSLHSHCKPLAYKDNLLSCVFQVLLLAGPPHKPYKSQDRFSCGHPKVIVHRYNFDIPTLSSLTSCSFSEPCHGQPLWCSWHFTTNLSTSFLTATSGWYWGYHNNNCDFRNKTRYHTKTKFWRYIMQLHIV